MFLSNTCISLKTAEEQQISNVCGSHFHRSFFHSPHFSSVHFTRPATPSNKKGLSAAASLSILLSAWPSSHTNTQPMSLSVKDAALFLYQCLTQSHTQTGEWMLWGLSVSLGAWQTLHRTGATETNLCDGNADEELLHTVRYKYSGCRVNQHIQLVQCSQEESPPKTLECVKHRSSI